ncbi:hypothetical protein [Kordiimonas sp.]|uniref:hypothetical protein n=1 Tax=Kordiimonas sp. TaxID=1970157 RepID=UPI003A8DA217
MRTPDRICRLCGDPGMKPESRDWTGMETTVTYACPGCDNTVKFNALSQAGLMSALGLIVLAIVTFFMVESPGMWETSDFLIYGGILLACAYVPLNILLPHWRYPISPEGGKRAPVTPDDNSLHQSTSDPLRRKIIEFERHGFWRGFLTPIVFIVIVLAAATLIGMLTF